MLLVLMIGLLSCSKGAAGVYVNSKEAKMELKSDGSFSIYEKGVNKALATGTYTVKGNDITFALTGLGRTGTGKIDGNSITDPDGETWKKQ